METREALRQHELSYVVGVNVTTKVRTRDPNAVSSDGLPEPGTLLEVARELPGAAWKTVTWREGSKGPMRSRFALVKVWASHGFSTQRHFERAAEWLLIEWPKHDAAPANYWLGYFGAGVQPALRQMVELAHARRCVELDCREMKDELGLDHFEGRHWLGFHHHVTLVSMAYVFLRSGQLRRKKSRHTAAANGPPEASACPHPSERPMPMVPDKVPQLFVNTNGVLLEHHGNP